MVSESNPILIGVDGGGSSCRAAITVGGRRYEAKRGGANVSTDFDAAIATIRDALDAVRTDCGLGAEQFHAGQAHLGLAGVMNDAVAARVAAALPFAHIAVTDDRPTALAGALGDADGAVAAIGTGSFLARQTGGQAHLAGGYGFAIGDQASGAWLGRALFERVMLCIDGFAPWTDLGRALLAEHGADPSALVAFSVAARPRDFAGFAPRIAASDDPLAVSLMSEGAAYIHTGLTAMGWRDGQALCLMGGLGPSYRAHLPQAMQDAVATPKGSALDGAMTLAARALETRG